MLKLPKAVESILKSINSLGYEAFVVGGWVRDNLLGKKTLDIDICTSAQATIIFDLVKSYNPSNQFESLGSVSFNVDDYNIEITTYREEFEHLNQRKPEKVVFVSDLETDLKRRDFTINAICYNPDIGLVDLFNGQEDLKEGILRSIGDPLIRFNEDLLRIVRLVRFKSYLNFEIENETLIAAKNLSPMLKKLNIGSWRKEFLKIMNSPNLLRVCLEDDYLFRNLIPELNDSFRFEQLNPYHKYSLYEHTVRVMGCLPSRLDMRLAGLFHDLGKLEVQNIDDLGVGHYRYHAKASNIIAIKYCEALQVRKKDKETIYKLVENHDIKLKETLESIYLFAFENGVSLTRDLIQFKRCDNTAKSELAAYQVDRCDVFDEILDEVEDYPFEVSDLMIKNDDLLKIGVSQKNVSKVLNELLNRSVKTMAGNNKQLQMELLKGVLEDDIY